MSDFTGKSWLVDIQRATRRTTSVISQWLNNLVREINKQRRIAHLSILRNVTQADIPATAVIRIIPRKEIHRRADPDVVDIALSA